MAEAPQPKQQTLTLLSIIEELGPTEVEEVKKVFKHPSVIRYFRAIGLKAMFENASASQDDLAQARNNDKYVVAQAYNKGIIDLIETFLNTVNKE